MLPRPLRRLAGLALTASALTTAACGGDDSTGPEPTPADVSGTYVLTGLRSLGNLGGGGSGLPVTFVDGGGSTLTFSSGELTLSQDGTYGLEVEARFNTSDVLLEDEGTYEVSGSTITFTPTSDPARLADGTISGNMLTAEVQFGGLPFEIDLAK